MLIIRQAFKSLETLRIMTQKLKILFLPKGKDWVAGVNKLKKVYKYSELSSTVKGKRVKYWKEVVAGDQIEQAEFIPIYYKSKE